MMNIQEDHNYVLYLNESKLNRELDLSSILAEATALEDVEAARSVENLIYRLLSNVLSASSMENAEIMIRLEKPYASDATKDNRECIYWHVDKSYNEITGQRSMSDHELFKQNIFIIVLKGESTLYYADDDVLRAEFFHLGYDSQCFFGSNALGCAEGDNLGRIFDKSKIVKQEGCGSVHIASSVDGAVHASPTYLNEGRLLLLITPMNFSA